MNDKERKLISEIQTRVFAAAKENASNQKLIIMDCHLDSSVFVQCDLHLAYAKSALNELLK